MIGGAPKKIVLLGDMAVGKSSIALRLTKNIFSADYVSTIGVKMHKTTIDMPDGEQRTSILWDTDGEFGEHIFETVYLKGAAGALIICDVTRPRTVEKMIQLSTLFEEYLPGRPCLCVFNKCDLAEPDDATRESVRKVTDFVADTSAKTGDGVGEALGQLLQLIQTRDEENA